MREEGNQAEHLMGGWGKTCVMSLGCRGKADGKLSHIK